MKKIFSFFLLFCAFLSCKVLGDSIPQDCCVPVLPCFKSKPHLPYIGSDIYYVQRLREGGSKQSGPMFGVKVGYDYLKRFRPYIGLEGLWAWGPLTGKSSAGDRIKSHLTDIYGEGRIGYTLQQKEGWKAMFTPFVGGGYFEETNRFVSPTPIKVHFKIEYWYVTSGFLSKVTLTPDLDVMLNFKVRWMYNPRNTVSNDPQFDKSTMLVKSQRLQYRVDLPFVYRWNSCFLLYAGPYYEYRHYGHQVNFPFDFFETSMEIWGGTFRLIYNF